MPSSTTYRQTTVYADWLDKTYPAEIVDGEYWNGYVIPRFTAEVAAEIVADQVPLAAAEQADELIMEGESIKVIPLDGDHGDVSYIFADEDGMYAIGAMEWTWTEAEMVDHDPDESGEVHAVFGDTEYILRAGASTVNVWRRDENGQPHNFDAFTIDREGMDHIQIYHAIRDRHNSSMEADFRYTGQHSGERMMYG